MTDDAIERARERLEAAAEGRPDPAAVEAALERARAQIEELAQAAAELETTLPARVEHALEDGLREGLREQVKPVGRNLAEIRGLTNQVIRRLERIEGDLLAERHARVDDLALLVDLVSSGWKSVDERLGSLEHSLKTGESAIVYRIEERRAV
jgi:flagellar biosynthesis/type III secretory pathway protein FliH